MRPEIRKLGPISTVLFSGFPGALTEEKYNHKILLRYPLLENHQKIFGSNSYYKK
jgi:hypothetical protein